jgi:hypothetical protein
MTHFASYAALQTALDIPAANPGAFRFCKPYGPATFECADCKAHKPLNTSGHGCGTGYARAGQNDDTMICYECAGAREVRDLLATGKGCLYLSSGIGQTGRTFHKLANWPGTLEISLSMSPRKGRHNMAGTRYDVWFSWQGRDWHGVQYGDNTQICHVRALKGGRA